MNLLPTVDCKFLPNTTKYFVEASTNPVSHQAEREFGDLLEIPEIPVIPLRDIWLIVKLEAGYGRKPLGF